MIEFDDDALYLYENRLFRRLTENGIVFFEIRYNYEYCDFSIGSYIELDYDEQKQLVALPNRWEVIYHYGIYKKYS